MEIESRIREKCFYDFITALEGILNTKDQVPLFENVRKRFREARRSIYSAYPFYFATFYPNIEEKTLFNLSLCGNLYHAYIMMQDTFVDSHLMKVSLLPMLKIHEATLMKIMTLFPNNSLFWDFLNYTVMSTSFVAQRRKIFLRVQLIRN